ncbi:FAD-dependent monooxygenase [Nonomuraea sp. NBC_01738]|uniref:FAD-dependent monooxygenase n=1 Tax=Nonomuraea sp. NBC_01738 TaxID=2976003 RepID=UPI002E0F3C24|nr:FAD-dependent monooxygenase [Nonomuraea sp. NBC_01738]
MRILISGGSVAGPALAYWLNRDGHETTLVERAPGVRGGGAAIDFRGSALTVLDRMGLLAEMERHQTRMASMTLVDEHGGVVAELPATAISGDLEVLKSDVTRVLYEATKATTDYLFDDTITALEERADGVHVSFENAQARTFDLVVGADGLHSTVRRLAFGPEADYLRHLGIYGALFTTGNLLGLRDAGLMHNTAGRSAMAFTAGDNTELRVGLSFVAQDLVYDRRDRAQQEKLVADHYADGGWEVPRLLEAMRGAGDFFFDSSSQVVMDSWSKGRVVLLGDAAYCAAPTSGRGTSQALIGAYVLAGELAENKEHDAAFASYEHLMRDYVERNQRHGRAAARWFFQQDAEELTEEADDNVPLKDYDCRNRSTASTRLL